MTRTGASLSKNITLLALSLLIIIFSPGFASSAGAGDAPDNSNITLDEYLRIISAKHPLFEGESLSADLEESRKEANLGSKDWTIRANSGYSRYVGTTGGIDPDLSEEYAGGISLERSIWSTGGRIKARIDNSYTRSEFDPSLPFSVGPGKLYESRGTLSYSQPLLRNRGGTLDRLGFDLAAFSVDITKLRALENQENFTLSVALKFMDWVLLTEKRLIAKRRLALAVAQLIDIQKKRKANLVDEIDKLRAIDSKVVARANLLLVEANWKAKRAELAILAQRDAVYTSTPVFDIYATGMPTRLSREPKELLGGSRLLKALDSRIAQLTRERSALKSREKPDLSLDGSLSMKGAGESLNSSAANDGVDASLSVNFAYPLGNRTASAWVKAIELQIRRARLERDKVRLTLYAALKGLTIQIEEFENIVKINAEQIKSARARTKEELKRYHQGRSDFTFVIQSQDSEQRAALTFAGNAARYHSLILELRALSDDLLSDNKATTGGL